MGVEVKLTPQRDEGTRTVSHRTEPETFSSPVPGPPTGKAKQQDAEDVHEDLTHLGKPTGAAKQAEGPTTYEAEWPKPAKAAKAGGSLTAPKTVKKATAKKATARKRTAENRKERQIEDRAGA